MAMLDDLLDELFNLSRTLKSHDIPFILGGGMGLFVRDTYHNAKRQRRYPKGMRVRPNESDHIHAYLTNEARAIERGAVTIRIPQRAASEPADEAEVLIPSSFNYLILKLHAFGDRHDDPVRAGHHALDIFRIVTDMSEQD